MSTAAAEANIYNDPEAAQIVFQAGWLVTMVGLDVGDKTLFSKKYLDQLGQDPRADERFHLWSCKISASICRRNLGRMARRCMIRLAVGVAIDASLVKAPRHACGRRDERRVYARGNRRQSP